MKKILYLEPVGGVAGDMFLAAAIDLGVPEADLRAGLDTLRLPGWRLSTSRAARHSITGTHLDVQLIADSPAGERSLVEIREIIRSANGLSARVRERALEIFDLIGQAEAKIHEVPIEKIHFHEVGKSTPLPRPWAAARLKRPTETCRCPRQQHWNCSRIGRSVSRESAS